MKAADVVIEIVSRKRCALLSRRWSENAQRHVGHHVNLFLDTDMAEIPGWLDLRLIEVNPCRISINSPHGTGLAIVVVAAIMRIPRMSLCCGDADGHHRGSNRLCSH